MGRKEDTGRTDGHPLPGTYTTTSSLLPSGTLITTAVTGEVNSLLMSNSAPIEGKSVYL